MEKIERRPALEAEIKDLQDQMDLYIKSNPNYATKTEVVQISEKDVHNRVVSALNLLGQLRTIHSLMQADGGFVETADA